jgi:hypothetical protein
VLTHHWNWAFGQEMTRNGAWTRPHLPTISARALVHLLEDLGAHNVLLDCQGSSLHEVASHIGEHLVSSDGLAPHLREQVVEIIRSRSSTVANAVGANAHELLEPSRKPTSGGAEPVVHAGAGGGGGGGGGAHAAPPAPASASRVMVDLSPDEDEEALELLVANVSFVPMHRPLMAFVRCVAAPALEATLTLLPS